jgi:L-asparaginase/Glu-tRNA(Gln) amidotransferase subunit D
MKMPRVLVIATGGTIDSAYDPAHGTPEVVPTPGKSAIPEALAQLGWTSGQDYHFERFYHKDSQHLHRQHMQAIAHYLQQHPEYEKVIITHGTDTMPRNGRYLSTLLEQHVDYGLHRTVIFCGAMQPLRSAPDLFLPEERTDAWRNLRLAMEQASKAKPGVYLTDGDILHSVFDVEKSRAVKDGIVTDAKFVGRVHPYPDPSIDLC